MSETHIYKQSFIRMMQILLLLNREKKFQYLHCLVAATITLCNLPTRFSDIDGERFVKSGVMLLAPNS